MFPVVVVIRMLGRRRVSTPSLNPRTCSRRRRWSLRSSTRTCCDWGRTSEVTDQRWAASWAGSRRPEEVPLWECITEGGVTWGFTPPELLYSCSREELRDVKRENRKVLEDEPPIKRYPPFQLPPSLKFSSIESCIAVLKRLDGFIEHTREEMPWFDMRWIHLDTLIPYIRNMESRWLFPVLTLYNTLTIKSQYLVLLITLEAVQSWFKKVQTITHDHILKEWVPISYNSLAEEWALHIKPKML